MGLLNKRNLDKAKGLLGKNAEKVKGGIDKAADVAGKKLGHKIDKGKIDSYAEKAKGAVGKLADEPATDSGAATGTASAPARDDATGA